MVAPLNAGELHKIIKYIFISTSRLWIVDVVDLFDFQRNINQATNVGRAPKSAGERQGNGKLG